MKKLVLIALTAATHYSLNAQSITMDDVIIESNRIKEAYGRQNRNIQVLDSKQIMAMPVKSVNELLSYVGGADLRQRGPSGTQADISIDGSTFDEVLVLVNGVKMSDPQTGHHLLNIPIPLTAIHHIEILRGPAARIYGLNALAGAINIVTKVPADDKLTVQAYAGSSLETDTASGNTYLNSGLQFTGAVVKKNHSHMLAASMDNGNGYRYNTPYDNYKLFYQNKVKLGGKTSIDAMGGYINNDFGANSFYAAPGDKDSKEKVQTATGAVALNYMPTAKVTIMPRLSYRYNCDDYIYIRQKPAVYHNYHETNVITGEVQSSISVKNGIIGVGAEYRDEHINSTNLGKRERSNMGIYAEYKHYFSEKLNAGAGVYANNNSDYGWQLFPGADIGYNFIPKWKFFANANFGQRLPTYTDLYYKGPTNIGNSTLTPEYAYQAEGGLQFEEQSLFVQASYFYRATTDFIDWVRISVTNPWQPQNFQSVNTQGLSAQLKYELSQALNMSEDYRITLNANYTYLNPVIDKPTADISKYVVEALRHQVNLSLRTLFFNKLQVNLNGRYLYRINNNDYALLDARLGYQFSKFMVYADVNNILDTRYKEIAAVPLPGRWFTLGLRALID